MRLSNVLPLASALVCLCSRVSCGHPHKFHQPYHYAPVTESGRTPPIPKYLFSIPDTPEDAVARVLTTRNRWGVTYNTFDVEPYNISVKAYLKNYPFHSVENIQQLYIEVFQDVLHKINTIREIRPNVDSFPITPKGCCLQLELLGSTYATTEDSRPDLQNPEQTWPSHMSVYMDGYNKIHFEQRKAGESIPICEPMPVEDAQGVKSLFSVPCPRENVYPKPSLRPFPRRARSSRSCGSCGEIPMLAVVVMAPVVAVAACVRAPLWLSEKICSSLSNDENQARELEERRKLANRQRRELCKKYERDWNERRKSFEWFCQKNYFVTLGANTWKGGQRFDFFAGSIRILSLEQARSLVAQVNSDAQGEERFTYKLTFWDENLDRSPSPYIAEIRMLKEKIFYYTADENQNLIQIFEENYPEPGSQQSP